MKTTTDISIRSLARTFMLALFGTAFFASSGSGFGQLASTTQPNYNATYAFGFSWTDTHSDCNWSPCCYWKHVASNGPLWSQYLSSILGVADNRQYNLAHCGALTSDVLNQAFDFKRNNNDPAQGLFCVMSGATDFLHQGRDHPEDLANDT